MRGQREAQHAHHRRYNEAKRYRLESGSCSTLRVLLTDPPCYQRGDPDTEPKRNCVYDGQHGLGEPDRRDSGRPQSCHKKHVRHSEHRLHGCFEDHRHSKQQNGSSDGPGREILLRSSQSLFQRRPEAERRFSYADIAWQLSKLHLIDEDRPRRRKLNREEAQAGDRAQVQ